MGVFSWRGLVTPNFQHPLSAKLCVRPKSFRGARTCSRFSVTMPTLVCLGFHPPPTRHRGSQERWVFLSVGPITNLKGHYFQSSLSVCLSVCLWPSLLPFNVDRFWWNLVTRTLLWSSLAATIMVQIGHRGTVRRLFENLKKFSKIKKFEFQNSGPSFFVCVSCVL